MSKPDFPIAGPYPSLRADLPLHDPRECAQCGSGKSLQVWQECDTADVPTAIYIVLCEKCAAEIIEPHPRLYNLLEANCPAPGVMPICMNCVYRAGSGCYHPEGWLRGKRGIKLEYPSPTTGFIDYAGKGGKRQGGPFRIYPGQVYNCSGKRLDPTMQQQLATA